MLKELRIADFFTDEPLFHLNGYVTFQNMCLWRLENPHYFRKMALRSLNIGVEAILFGKKSFNICNLYNKTQLE